MNEAVGVKDVDLDIHNFCKNDMFDTESVLYVRTLREDDDNVDIYDEIAGNVGDIIGAFIHVEHLRDLAITSVAIMIKEEGLDINKYVEQI